jgi:hypothetical protein
MKADAPLKLGQVFIGPGLRWLSHHVCFKVASIKQRRFAFLTQPHINIDKVIGIGFLRGRCRCRACGKLD